MEGTVVVTETGDGTPVTETLSSFSLFVPNFSLFFFFCPINRISRERKPPRGTRRGPRRHQYFSPLFSIFWCFVVVFSHPFFFPQVSREDRGEHRDLGQLLPEPRQEASGGSKARSELKEEKKKKKMKKEKQEK